MLHQTFGADCRVVHEGAARREHFTEIVRRDVGRHADRDPAGAVDEEVGEAGGEDLGLALGRVVIGLEIDGVLVNVAEEEIGDLAKARFGVPHGRRRIRVHRAEVTLTIDQRDSHRPALRHSRKGVVNRLVAVRVILTHDVTDDAARLAIRPAGDIARLLAGVEDSAVDRLQAVANVGQRPADDHAHRVIEVAGLHLVNDGDRGDVPIAAGRRIWVAARWRAAVVAVVCRRLSGQESILLVRVHTKVAAKPRPPLLII